VLCKSFGPPENLSVEEVPSLKAGPGEAVVTVKAAGVNFPDTLIIQGKYQFKPSFPFSPGGEVAGVIKEVGQGVTDFKPGDEVIAFAPFGGYAEEMLANSAQLMRMPEGMDFEHAASFVTTYGTTHYALRELAELKPAETLLVLGAAGGVGLAAIEIGKRLGAKVIAAAATEEKLQFCLAHGADEVINYESENLKDRVRELTGGAGADVVYDPVGAHFAEPAIRSLAWRGRYLVVGFAGGEIPKIPLNLLLLKGASAIGVFWGSFVAREPARNQAYLREIADWIADGSLKPHISASYPLSRVADALNDVLGRKVKGKVVLVP
jgi:NADPH:quinone reductase